MCYGTLSLFDVQCYFCAFRKVVISHLGACAAHDSDDLRMNVTFHASSPTHASFSALQVCLHLRVTNVGLVEFTAGHAPSVQLVATLLMTSLPRTPIGLQTSHTCPIAWR